MKKKKNNNLKSYEDNIREIKYKGKKWGLSPEEINFAYEESFLYLREKYPNINSRQKPSSSSVNSSSWLNRYLIKIIFTVAFIILIGLGLNYNKPAHNFIERNIQEIIYPFMKLYRIITLPLVLSYPSLSELYDESCLLENPYFQVSNMDCWPCENIKFVLNLTDSKQNNAHVGLPYIIKDNCSIVNLSQIKNIYHKYHDVMSKHAEKIQSNYKFKTASELFSQNWSDLEDLHVSWRINRMEPARVLRHILGLPKNVANYETSILIERYLLYDEPKSSSYQIPATEGANVFLKQLSGSRLIVLEPTSECLNSCQRLSVLLQEQHILWYNWWYWRPRSLPVINNTQGSLALLGSAV
ncbi:conserved hypothetical protein [Pediculus humanus corporis]|uniref:Uncharacterized protein n=1 Tax=Pediculus humanus subsp. corporis TaxID=121224 RepID=E0VCC6_PEDHC|nr:uncharacterized protein Phum_PHUM085440 [Pediculus humanus corporis]EEB11032.1 conserved hypothetical protein [Pediculus humanus corporis]